MTTLAAAIDHTHHSPALQLQPGIPAEGSIADCPLIGRTYTGQGVWLIWAHSCPGDLTETLYEAITEEAARLGLPDPCHVIGARSLFVTDDVAFHHAGDLGLHHDPIAVFEDLVWAALEDRDEILLDDEPVTGDGSCLSDAQWAAIWEHFTIERSGGALVLTDAARAALQIQHHTVPTFDSDGTDEDGVAVSYSGRLSLPLAQTTDPDSHQLYTATISHAINLDAAIHHPAGGRPAIHQLRDLLLTAGQQLTTQRERAALQILLPDPDPASSDQHYDEVLVTAGNLIAELRDYLERNGFDSDEYLATRLH